MDHFYRQLKTKALYFPVMLYQSKHLKIKFSVTSFKQNLSLNYEQHPNVNKLMFKFPLCYLSSLDFSSNG